MPSRNLAEGGIDGPPAQATVEVPITGWKRDTPMQIVAGSFRPDGNPPVPVRVLCGDHLLCETTLQTTMGNYENIEFILPKRCIKNGRARDYVDV